VPCQASRSLGLPENDQHPQRKGALDYAHGVIYILVSSGGGGSPRATAATEGVGHGGSLWVGDWAVNHGDGSRERIVRSQAPRPPNALPTYASFLRRSMRRSALEWWLTSSATPLAQVIRQRQPGQVLRHRHRASCPSMELNNCLDGSSLHQSR